MGVTQLLMSTPDCGRVSRVQQLFGFVELLCVCRTSCPGWTSSLVQRTGETGVCVVMLTWMLWLVGQGAFDDTLNERSEGAAQRGEGGDLPHQTETPSPSDSSPSLQTLTERQRASMSAHEYKHWALAGVQLLWFCFILVHFSTICTFHTLAFTNSSEIFTSFVLHTVNLGLAVKLNYIFNYLSLFFCLWRDRDMDKYCSFATKGETSLGAGVFWVEDVKFTKSRSELLYYWYWATWLITNNDIHNYSKVYYLKLFQDFPL